MSHRYILQCRCCSAPFETCDAELPLCGPCKRSLQRHCGPSDRDPSWPMVEWAAKRAARLARKKAIWQSYEARP